MESVTLTKTPTTDAEYEAAIDQMMMQMQRMRVEIAEDHRLTDQIQSQTRKKLDHLGKILNRLEAS
ncbi:MAG: hypothetical protein ACRYFS_13825 [Janthinobacterium lividum]